MGTPRAHFLKPPHSVWNCFKQSLKASCSAETTHDSEGSTRNDHKLQPSQTRETHNEDDTEESESELVEKVVVESESPNPENWRNGKLPSNNGAQTATNTGHHPTTKSIASSHHSDADATILRQYYNFIRWRIIPALSHFCSPRYSDPEEEEAFQREVS